MSVKIGIVLTGTIKPNSNFVAINDVAMRRQQYLATIKFYRQFAPVYFVENSAYDLVSDKDFSALADVTIVKCPVSSEFSRGKGYQEFEMLDRFFSLADIPDFMIKVTGRYIIENFAEVMKDCISKGDAKVLINLHRRSKFADTYLLGFDTLYYQQNLLNLYRLVDDEHGVYVEHVYYDFFARRLDMCRLFAEELEINAVSGSTGRKYVKNTRWKMKTKNMIRNILVKNKVKFLPW